MGILDDNRFWKTVSENNLNKLKATNPNTRDRYLLDNVFGSFTGNKRKPDFPPPDSIISGGIPPKTYNIMSSPAASTARGLIGDVATGYGNIFEAGKTAANKYAQIYGSIIPPTVDFFTSSNKETPFGIPTGDEIRSGLSNLDTTFDAAKNPFPEDSLIRKLGDNEYVKKVFSFIKNEKEIEHKETQNSKYNYPAFDLETLKATADKVAESGGNVADFYANTYGKGFGKVRDVGSNIVNFLSNSVDNGEVSKSNISQSQVNTIVNATSKASGAAGVIAGASNQVTEALGTKEKNETTADKLKSGIDTFLNDLDKPGFQVALAMHMEAKNGGDITSVLFEGMKVKKRAEKDLLAAHINNLQTSKLELDIIKAYQSVGKTEQPQKELISALTAQFNSAPYKLGDKSGSAAYAISLMAMETAAANPGMDPYTASQLVINTLPEGVLEKNGWNPFAGGDFDPSKLATANAQINPEVVAISALQRQANAQGIDIQTALQQAEDSGIIVDHMR
tara:strand:+ start:1859 stop:3379 length:1521 start_codon:yes stop_codon:yes gene_type:complete